jgi:hypothetical protein
MKHSTAPAQTLLFHSLTLPWASIPKMGALAVSMKVWSSCAIVSGTIQRCAFNSASRSGGQKIRVNEWKHSATLGLLCWCTSSCKRVGKESTVTTRRDADLQDGAAAAALLNVLEPHVPQLELRLHPGAAGGGQCYAKCGTPLESLAPHSTYYDATCTRHLDSSCCQVFVLSS